MNEATFRRYGRYYDLLYRDKDYVSEARYVATTLGAIAPDAKQVLEFGAGTGRHGRLLAGLGFQVVGVERSEAMIEAARRAIDDADAARRPGDFECVHGDIRSVGLARKFDAVISLFHVVSYQTTNADVLAVFENAARHLDPGGVFFFDVWHGPAVLKHRPAVRVKRVSDGELDLVRIAEPELDVAASVVTVRYSMYAQGNGNGSGSALTQFNEEHRMRYFFPTELELFAQVSGFELLRSEEFLTGRAPSEDTWGVAYMFKRRSA